MPEFIEEIVSYRQIACKYCGHNDLMKNGSLNGVQYYLCKNCRHRSTGIETFPHHRYSKDTITRALTYYYNGMSYKGVVNSFDDLDNIRLSKSTIWDWVIKFTREVIPYVKHVKPRKIGDSWFADETMIKMHGKNRWLWAVIDEDTRYLLACNLTVNRTTKTATKLFYDAYLHAGRKPFTISTDKLQAYEGAFKKVFLRRFGKDKSYHLQSHGFRSPTNTNLIERWNEYIKQRSKVMRYFKRPDSAFTVLQGIIINYNYLWEHSTLDNQVPAQVAGINVEGLGIKNWGDLINLSIQHRKEVKNPSEVVWYLDEMKRMKSDFPH